MNKEKFIQQYVIAYVSSRMQSYGSNIGVDVIKIYTEVAIKQANMAWKFQEEFKEL